MIRRISKNNDYRDIIKSCPTGVIDDVHTIKYFIAGHPETEFEATFTKKGNVLEVIIPSSSLTELPNGVLMRRALYSDVDTAFPDGEYNLEFVDDLNVWLGDEEVDPPFDPGYLTEDDLKTINGDSIVGVGNIDVVNYIPSYYVTESWISSQHFASVTYVQNIISSVESGIASDLSSFATQEWVQSYTYDSSTIDYQCDKATSNAIDWVQEQGYLTASTIPSDIATQSWVRSYTYDKSIIDALVGKAQGDALTDAQTWVSSQQFATQSWVLSQGYITVGDIPSGLATQSWVESYTYDKATIAVIGEKARLDAFGDAQTWVSSQQFATQSWVQSQGYLTQHQDLTGYATESWVSSQGYLTSVPSGYATESFVTTALSGYATQSWVSSQGYLTSVPSGYATQSWVSSQQFATQSWVSSQDYLEESKVWCGTRSQWENMTSEEQATYKIALVTA